MEGETAALQRDAGARAQAARRLRRPARYHMMPEARSRYCRGASEPADARGVRAIGSSRRAQLAERNSLFPEGRLDQDLQQVDLRGRNSWRLLMAEVPSVELLEVQLVNAIAPFILNARLKPLMLRTPERDKHIVNVSAVEGQFYRTFKTTRHPHTNMAKAALNMMTRTRPRITRRRHPHEQRRHRLGDRRGSGGHRRAQDRRSIAFIRRSTSSMARRASSIRSSPVQYRQAHVGEISEGLSAHGLVAVRPV